MTRLSGIGRHEAVALYKHLEESMKDLAQLSTLSGFGTVGVNNIPAAVYVSMGHWMKDRILTQQHVFQNQRQCLQA